MKNIIFILLSSFIVQSLSQVPPYGDLCFERGCIYQKEIFSEGSTFTLGCSTFTCIKGTWIHLSISERCALCFVDKDPNIYTFDDLYYTWNGQCNYTLTQPFNCRDTSSSDNPPYGIFSDFEPCNSGTASCVGITTFKVDVDTVAVVDHSILPSFFINNNFGTPPSNPANPSDCLGNNYPVLAWIDWHYGFIDQNCIFIVSAKYTLVACSRGLVIYSIPEHVGEIAGLCGTYTYTKDDWLSRSCVNHDENNQLDLQPFAESWETLEQKDRACQKGGIIQIENCDQFREECTVIVNEAFANCGYPRDQSLIKFAIESCINDCCTDPDSCDYWKIQAFNSACIMAELSNLQSGGGKG